MKNILIALIALISIQAFATEQEPLTCPYRGSEQKLAQAVKAQIVKDILLLKEKGIAVAESSIRVKAEFASASAETRPAWIRLSGSFRSSSGTSFTLKIAFRPRDGMFGVFKDLMGYYSDLQYDELDAEGNPLHGRCYLVTNANILVMNVNTSALVAQFPALPLLEVR